MGASWWQGRSSTRRRCARSSGAKLASSARRNLRAGCKTNLELFYPVAFNVQHPRSPSVSQHNYSSLSFNDEPSCRPYHTYNGDRPPSQTEYLIFPIITFLSFKDLKVSANSTKYRSSQQTSARMVMERLLVAQIEPRHLLR
jgi:hypothetical protein